MSLALAPRVQADDDSEDDKEEKGPPGPAIVSPSASADVVLGRKLVVKVRPYRGTDEYMCKLRQGSVEIDGDSERRQRPVCNFSSLAVVGNAMRAGPAEVLVAAHTASGWTADSKLAITFKAAVPKGGAGNKWDGVYWKGSGGGFGELTCGGATVKNGVMTIPVAVGNISFGKVHAIVEKDGTIVRQTFELPKGTAKAGVKIYSVEESEAADTKQVTVSGSHATTFQETYFTLRIEGATSRNGQLYCDARMFKKGDGWSRSSMPDCPSVPQCGLYADCCPDNPRN